MVIGWNPPSDAAFQRQMKGHAFEGFWPFRLIKMLHFPV